MEQKDKKVIKIKRAERPKIVDRDNQFVATPFGAIDSPDYRHKNQCPTMLLTYLIRHVVRAPMRDGLNIYNDYYKNNYLACSMSQGHLARAFNVNERTIRRWVKSLTEDECIRVDKIHIDGYKKQNIYILGTHVGYDFCYFIEEVYTKK